MTFYGWVLMIGGYGFALFGVLIAALVIRSARKRPARHPVRTVVPAGRVYVSRAAGVGRARDRAVAPPVMEAGATTYLPAHPTWTAPGSRHVQVRSGRHRETAGARR